MDLDVITSEVWAEKERKRQLKSWEKKADEENQMMCVYVCMYDIKSSWNLCNTLVN